MEPFKIERQSDWTDEAVEKLITSVRQQPAIWDVRSPNHRNRMLVALAWQLVTKELKDDNIICTQAVAIMEWTRLRKYFTSLVTGSRKRAGKSPDRISVDQRIRRWRFGKYMEFVRPTVMARRIVTNSSNSIQVDNGQDQHQYQQQQPQRNLVPATRKRKADDSTDNSPDHSLDDTLRLAFMRQVAEDNDENMTFFRSLTLMLRKLPSKEQRRLRLEFHQSVEAALGADQNNSVQ